MRMGDYPLLLTIEIKNDNEYKIVSDYIELLKITTEQRIDTSDDPSYLQVILDILNTASYGLGNRNSEARVMVGHNCVSMGTHEAMLARYYNEKSMHGSKNVRLELWRNGKYVSVKSSQLINAR